jgi:hypothetical protein
MPPRNQRPDRVLARSGNRPAPRHSPALDPYRPVRPALRRLDERSERPGRRGLLAVGLAVLVLAAVAVGIARVEGGAHLSPLRSRIVSTAEGQLGYRTDPPDSYCNKFSAYWHSGTACGPGLASEEWCADFAAWVWQQAGALVVYQYAPGDLNSSSASFYEWGVAHGTWHPVGSGYTPEPGDVAVYGLDPATLVAQHVAVVTGYPAGGRGPDVVNGDGDRSAFSIVETGTDQYQADTHSSDAPLSGYVAPTARSTGAPSS